MLGVKGSIERIHRIGKLRPGGVRPVIMKFIDCRKRECVAELYKTEGIRERYSRDKEEIVAKFCAGGAKVLNGSR